MTMQRISTQHNGGDQVEKLAMVNCLTLLSRINKTGRSLTGRDFKCKTCKRQFPTFQALGGHRANHKKPKLIMAQLGKKPKTHECSICGVVFEKGQALGGHMRRHGGLAMKEDDLKSSSSNSVITNPPPVSNSRIFCEDEDLDLDLKLGW